MIALVVFTEEDEKTGRLVTLVSHGVDIDTLENVTLPQVEPETIGVRHPELGWVLK